MSIVETSIKEHVRYPINVTKHFSERLRERGFS